MELVSEGDGRPGDISQLVSPTFDFQSGRLVTFVTKMSSTEEDVLPKLDVFLRSETDTQHEPILSIKKSWSCIFRFKL